MEETIANVGIIFAFILIGIAILAMVVFPLMYVIKHPKEARDTVIGIVALAALFLLSYIFASSGVLPSYEKYGVGPGESKLIGAGLVSFYILGVGAIATAVYVEVSNLFK